MHFNVISTDIPGGLNESPYEKVGKSATAGSRMFPASSLNESPYEKVGKCPVPRSPAGRGTRLNESPYEKVGKSEAPVVSGGMLEASMKVPTKK